MKVGQNRDGNQASSRQDLGGYMGIILNEINKSYGEKIIFRNFSYEFEEKQTTCVMGESGRGKTTLLKLIMGLENIDSGEIVGVKNKRTSGVFQEDRLIENISAIANLKLVTNKSSYELNTLIEKMNLKPNDKTKIKEYSGGMKKRVAIARALVVDADIILMDEPLAGLDETTKNKVIETIIEYTKDKVLIIALHDKGNCSKFNARLLEI